MKCCPKDVREESVDRTYALYLHRPWLAPAGQPILAHIEATSLSELSTLFRHLSRLHGVSGGFAFLVESGSVFVPARSKQGVALSTLEAQHGVMWGSQM